MKNLKLIKIGSAAILVCGLFTTIAHAFTDPFGVRRHEAADVRAWNAGDRQTGIVIATSIKDAKDSLGDNGILVGPNGDGDKSIGPIFQFQKNINISNHYNKVHIKGSQLKNVSIHNSSKSKQIVKENHQLAIPVNN